jgi:hypothetical protein
MTEKKLIEVIAKKLAYFKASKLFGNINGKSKIETRKIMKLLSMYQASAESGKKSASNLFDYTR